MIEIMPSTAPGVYLLLVALIMLLVVYLFRSKKKKLKLLIIAQEHVSCSFCHYGYLVARHHKIHRCPRCKLLNDSL